MDKKGALIEIEEKDIETVKNRPKTQAEYIEELKIYIESIPGPNEGRILELRDMIRKGKLATKEAVRESAEKLMQQFLGRYDA